MRIAGFNFKKISVEKLKDNTGEIKINTKIDIPEITKLESDLVKPGDELLKADFVYVVDYDPEFAKIELEGNIIVAVSPDEAKEILEQWKDKQMSESLRMSLFNLVIRKSNIKALELEDEMNLPLHIPFPSLKPEQKKEE